MSPHQAHGGTEEGQGLKALPQTGRSFAENIIWLDSLMVEVKFTKIPSCIMEGT